MVPTDDKLVGRQMMLGCGACQPCCRDGVTTVAGKTAEASTLMIGEVPADARARIIGSADQKFSWFTPTLELADGPEPARMHLGSPAPTGEITGPCAFGGCSQLCCDVKFDAHRTPKAQLSDIGVIVKRKPKGMTQALRELLTTADTYTIEFTDPSLTPEKKASVLTSLLLLDVRAKRGQA